MRTNLKFACATALAATLTVGCSGSSDVNPFAKIFGTVCSISETANSGLSLSCIDGELPEVLETVDDVVGAINDLIDTLEGLAQSNPLLSELPIDQITSTLTAALEQATADINSQLAGALPEEVSALVDQALADALNDNLVTITNLISPRLAELPDAAQTGDPLDVVRAALAGAGDPSVLLNAIYDIRDSVVVLESGLNAAALLNLAGDLLDASNSVQDAPAQLAGALEGLAGSLASGDPAEIAEAVEALSTLAETDAVEDLLSAAGGVGSIINLNPEDLTNLGSNEVIQGIGNTIGNLLGLGA